MPDLLSHLLIGLILAEIFNIKKKSLVVLGAILPDLLSKLHLIYLYFWIPLQISFISFHTPFMIFMLSLLISPLFMHNQLKTVLFINLGSMSHFLSDLMIKHFTVSGTRMLFPFSNQNYTLNLIWPEQSIYVLVLCSLIYALIKLAKKDTAFRSIKSYLNLKRK